MFVLFLFYFSTSNPSPKVYKEISTVSTKTIKIPSNHSKPITTIICKGFPPCYCASLKSPPARANILPELC